MSKQDVRKALVAMDGDDQVRGHLANGDFSDVADLELDDHERGLVRGAAEEYADVASEVQPFALYMKFGTVGGDVTTGGFDKWIELGPAAQKAVDYCAPHKHIAGVKYEDL